MQRASTIATSCERSSRVERGHFLRITPSRSKQRCIAPEGELAGQGNTHAIPRKFVQGGSSAFVITELGLDGASSVPCDPTRISEGRERERELRAFCHLYTTGNGAGTGVFLLGLVAC